MAYFLDTYMLIEIGNQRKALQPILDDTAVTLDYNIAELFYYFLKEFNEGTAEFISTPFRKMSASFPLPLVGKAMIFKYKHRKKRFSYIDAFGYVYAMENNLTFLTGDRAFKGMKNAKIVR